MKEIWKDIPNYEGLYQVSNLGRVKSLGNKSNHNKSIIMKLTYTKKGYLQVRFCKNYKKTTHRVHRLVAETFIDNPNNYKEVNHINGNKSDNRVCNLEFCNASMNSQHAWDNNLRTRRIGKKSWKAKKVNQYDLNGNFIKQWDCITDVQRTLKIPNQNICKVCQGKRTTAGGYIWKYV